MLSDLQIFRESLMQNHMSTYFANQIFKEIQSNTEDRLERVFQTALNRYAQVSFEKRGNDNGTMLTMLLKYFPTFPFVVASSFNQIQELKQFGKFIRLAHISRKIYELGDDNDDAVASFVSCFDSKDNEKTLSKKLTEENRDHAYLPKVLYKDFRYIRPTSSSILKSLSMLDRVENYLYYEGIGQLFLKFYFELLANVSSDIIASHLNVIFGSFLQLFHREELLYWRTQGTKQGARHNLHLLIEQDSPSVRHPHIRNHVFNKLHAFNPIIHDGRAYTSTVSLRKTLTKQLDSFHNMSYIKTAYFLNHVEHLKGKSFLIYLLSQIRNRGAKHLQHFQEFLRDNRNEENANIIKLVDFYISKHGKSAPSNTNKSSIGLAGGKTILGEKSVNKVSTNTSTQNTSSRKAIVGGKIIFLEDSNRLKRATKNLQLLKDRPSMALNQIEQYLEERLQNFLDNARIKGALTKNGITEYLKQFAHLTDNLLHQETVDKKSISALSSSTNTVLKSFLETGVLTADEVEDYKRLIQARMRELADAGIAKRMSLLDQIGQTLTEASSGKKQTEKKDLPFFEQDLIPLGFGENPSKISPKIFFDFPFSKQRRTPDKDCFQLHKKYLELSLTKHQADKELSKQLFQIIPRLKQKTYKKYFDIFPKDQFDDCVLMAVFSLWENHAFGKMLVEKI